MSTDNNNNNNNKNKTNTFLFPEKNVLSSQCGGFFSTSAKKKNNEKNGPNIPPKTNVHPKHSDSFLPHSHRPVESMEFPSPPPPWSIAWHGSAASKNCAKVVAGPSWPEARMFQPQMGGWKLIPGLGYVDSNHGLIG